MAVIAQIFFLFVFVVVSSGLGTFENFWQDDQYDTQYNIISKLISRLFHPHFGFSHRHHYRIRRPGMLGSGNLGLSNIRRPNSFMNQPKFSGETSDYGLQGSEETSSNSIECGYNPLDCPSDEDLEKQSDEKYNSDEETYNKYNNKPNGYQSDEKLGTDSPSSEINKPEQSSASNIANKTEIYTENITNDTLNNPKKSTLDFSPQAKDTSKMGSGLKTNHAGEKILITPRTEYNDSSDVKRDKGMYSSNIIFPEDIEKSKEAIIKRNTNEHTENQVSNISDRLGNNRIFYAINIAPSSSPSNPGSQVPKSVVPINVPSQLLFPNNILSVLPITMQNNGPLYSNQPNNVLVNLPINTNNQLNNIVPNGNMLPNTDVILTNPDGTSTRYSVVTIPNFINSGITNVGQFNSASNAPPETQTNNGYYQNTNSGQQSYILQLSNGQNLVSTNNAQTFIPNNVPIINQENSQVLLSSNSQFVPSDGQTSPQEQVDQILVSSNGQTFIPSGQNLPQDQTVMVADQNFIPNNGINLLSLSINENGQDNEQIMLPINDQSVQVNDQSLSGNMVSYGNSLNNDISLLVYKDKANSTSLKENSKDDKNESIK